MNIRTGSVYCRKDGAWCASLQVHGKRKIVYARTEQGARRRLADLQHQFAITGRLPDAGRRTVCDLLSEWLKSATLKPRTRADYENLGRRYIAPEIGKIRLSHLDAIHLQRLYNSLQSRGLKRAPAQVHAAMHRALAVAVRWGWLSTNPADRVMPPRYVAARKEVWSADHLRQFLQATIGSPWQPRWLLLAATGARIGEALALTWEDVDLDAATVRFRRTLHRLRGEWVLTPPKTQAGLRTVALPPEVLSALRHHRVRQDEMRLRAGTAWHGLDLVFTKADGRPIFVAAVGEAIAAAADHAGVPRITAHGFRHLHASLLLQQGMSVATVAARLGHANAGITTRIYSHALPGEDARAAAMIQAVLRRLIRRARSTTCGPDVDGDFRSY